MTHSPDDKIHFRPAAGHRYTMCGLKIRVDPIKALRCTGIAERVTCQACARIL